MQFGIIWQLSKEVVVLSSSLFEKPALIVYAPASTTSVFVGIEESAADAVDASRAIASHLRGRVRSEKKSRLIVDERYDVKLT